jgi:hypothetical protein
VETSFLCLRILILYSVQFSTILSLMVWIQQRLKQLWLGQVECDRLVTVSGMQVTYNK